MEWHWLYLQGDGKCLFHRKVMHGYGEVPDHSVGGTRWKNMFIWHPCSEWTEPRWAEQGSHGLMW